MLHAFPAYRLSDIFMCRVYDGGLSFPMLLELFRQADEIEYRRIRFDAACHGIDLDKEETSFATEETGFQFRAPEEYAAMTPEERQREQDRMMSHWKDFKLGDK